MEFQVASDLHLEFYKDEEIGLPYPEVTAPYLILAGDIGNPFKISYSIFLGWASQNYKWIFLLSGNHEYYSANKKRKMKEIDDKIQEVASAFPNVSYLNRTDWIGEGISVIGRTLWSDFSQCSPELKGLIKTTMNDYQNIYLNDGLISPDEVTQIHQEDLAYLKKRLNEFESNPRIRKIVVISHHAPTRLMLNPIYNGDLLGTAYANHLDDLIISHPKIAAWISGHTHYSQKMTLGSSILLSNCLGYKLPAGGFQPTGYDPRRLVEVSLS